MYLFRVIPSVPTLLSPHLTLPLLLHMKQQDQVFLFLLIHSILKMKSMRMKTFRMAHYLSNNHHVLQLINLSVVYVCVFLWKSNNCMSRTKWDITVSSLLSKYYPVEDPVQIFILKWMAYSYLGIRLVVPFHSNEYCFSFLTVYNLTFKESNYYRVCLSLVIEGTISLSSQVFFKM